MITASHARSWIVGLAVWDLPAHLQCRSTALQHVALGPSWSACKQDEPNVRTTRRHIPGRGWCAENIDPRLQANSSGHFGSMMEEFFCEIYVASNQGVFYLFFRIHHCYCPKIWYRYSGIWSRASAVQDALFELNQLVSMFSSISPPAVTLPISAFLIFLLCQSYGNMNFICEFSNILFIILVYISWNQK